MNEISRRYLLDISESRWASSSRHSSSLAFSSSRRCSTEVARCSVSTRSLFSSARAESALAFSFCSFSSSSLTQDSSSRSFWSAAWCVSSLSLILPSRVEVGTQLECATLRFFNSSAIRGKVRGHKERASISKTRKMFYPQGGEASVVPA